MDFKRLLYGGPFFIPGWQKRQNPFLVTPISQINTLQSRDAGLYLSSIGNERSPFHENSKETSLLVLWKNGLNKIILYLACIPYSLLNFCFRSHSAKGTDAHLPHCQPTGIRNLAHTKRRSPNRFLNLGVSLTSSVFAKVLWEFLCECFHCCCCVFVCLFLRKGKFPELIL